jgi:hypothetical protein
MVDGSFVDKRICEWMALSIRLDRNSCVQDILRGRFKSIHVVVVQGHTIA